MLLIIGAGLKGFFTKEGLEALRGCDRIYVETYTLPCREMEENIEEQLREMGKEWVVVEREVVESSKLVEEAREKDVALIVGGDVFAATTHYALVEEAREKGVGVKAIHNSSIFSAIARIGLSIYKFGATTTLAEWRENFKPMSPMDVIKKNMEAGYHTLVLVDTTPTMGLRKALFQLEEMGKEKGVELREVIVASKLSYEDEEILYGSVEELREREVEKPFSLVIPGRLSRIEEEFLRRYSIRGKLDVKQV